ncbi:MAG: adenine phosphoribosyltransferase, partial [Pseudomonadota bacterium]
SVDQLADRLAGTPLDKIAGVEARGFILGGALAVKMGLGFVPIRKRGKLPWKAISQDYELEYGVDQVEIHEDAVAPGERVAVVDDLIATGGTAFAGVKLVERLEGVVEDCAFVIDLPELGGADRLRDAGKRVHCLIAFDGH